MNSNMRRLVTLEKKLAKAAEQRADSQSKRLNELVRQIRRKALRSSTLTCPDLKHLRHIFQADPTIEFSSKELASLDRFRTLCEHFSKELSGEPFSVIQQKMNVDPLDLVRDVDRELAIPDLAEFVRQGWDVVEPAKRYIHNWHIDAICQHLEGVTRGYIRKLLINVPPGCAKSLLVSVLWPAWVWIQEEDQPGGPQWRALFTSYSSDLSLRDSIRCRLLLQSAWYQETFQPKWTLSDVQNSKSNFLNSEMGFRLSTSVGGRGTGFRGDCIVADDPLNAKESYSIKAREEVITRWDRVMSSRLDNKEKGARVVIMQRLHEQDLAGHLLEQGGYEHLCIPMEFEPERKFHTIGGEDPRSSPGELLFEELFPAHVLTETKREMGSAEYAGQYQQRPTPEGGGLIKQYWWRYWKPKGVELPPIMVRMANGDIRPAVVVDRPDDKQFDELIQSWDCAFKEGEKTDYVVGTVWGRKGADKFLLDLDRGRMDLPHTLQAVVMMNLKWPRAQAKLIEGKANGPAVIQVLRGKISGLIEVEPEGGKFARAAAVSPQIEASNVYLPHPAIASWVDAFIAECTAFPNGTFDDQVDSMSQALNRLGNKSCANIRSFMDSWEKGLPR